MHLTRYSDNALAAPRETPANDGPVPDRVPATGSRPAIHDSAAALAPRRLYPFGARGRVTGVNGVVRSSVKNAGCAHQLWCTRLHKFVRLVCRTMTAQGP